MAITLRTNVHASATTKGDDLTWEELDANFTSFLESSGSSLVGFLQSGTGASSRSVQVKLREIVSVTDFGAAGDGTTDDTSSIQAAINTRKSIYFPAGEYLVTNTLAFPTTTPPGGGFWLGNGMQRSNPQTGGESGPHTTLIWDGTIGETLLEAEGLAGWTFENMNFVGRPTSGASNRAGILVHMKTKVGFGNGRHTFRKCTFWDADVCVQYGEASGDVNCDTTIFEQVTFGNSTKGFVAKNTQSVVHRFVHLIGITTTNVIDMEQGGHIVVDQANFNACGGSGATDFCIRLQRMDTNTQIAILNDLRVENGTQKVLQATQATGRVLINGYNEAQTDTNALMFETNGPTLEFHSSRFVSNDSTTRPFLIENGAGGQRASMLFYACSFPVSTWTMTDWFEFTSNSRIGLKLQDCTYKTDSQRLPYINSSPEWGDVTHFGQTTGAVQTGLYFDGITNNTTALLRLPSGSLWQIDAHFVGRKTPTATATVTITNASPGVVTWTGHALVAGDPVYLTTTGTLPTGLSVRTLYYVVNVSGDTFQLEATVGGGAINTSSDGSGTHTAVHTLDMSFHRRLTVQDTGGVLVFVGAIETIGTDQNPRSCAVTLSNQSGTSIRALVTGLASTTINWRVIFKLTRLVEDVA